MKKYLFIILFFLILFNFSCSEGKNDKYLPNSNGRLNTISIVMPNKSWEGTLGQMTTKLLTKPYEGLPLDEERYSLNYIPSKVFSGFVRSYRNIILFKSDSIPNFQINKNKYAKGQVVIEITASSDNKKGHLLELNIKEIINSIDQNETYEKLRRIKKSPSIDKSIKTRFEASLLFPSAYKLVKDTFNFTWFQKEIQKGHLNFIVYQISSSEFKGNIKNRLIQIRDSIGGIYLPGRLLNSHMITEKAYRPYFYKTQILNRKTYLTKGMWEVKNDFMAGPFVNYMIYDSIKKNWLVLEGFCFAPSVKKRDLMFELNTILKSVEFK